MSAASCCLTRPEERMVFRVGLTKKKNQVDNLDNRNRESVWYSINKWFWNHESRLNIHQSMWIQWQFLQKLEPKVIDPKMTFNPTSVEVLCVSLPKDHCVQVPWKYIMWIQWPFLQKLEPKSVTPRWPLTPHLLSLMCDSTQGSLCPSPMKIHQSMWIQWPFLQKKLEPKVIDP